MKEKYKTIGKAYRAHKKRNEKKVVKMLLSEKDLPPFKKHKKLKPMKSWQSMRDDKIKSMKKVANIVSEFNKHFVKDKRIIKSINKKNRDKINRYRRQVNKRYEKFE